MSPSERSRSRSNDSVGGKKSKSRTLKAKLKCEKERSHQLELNIKALTDDLNALKSTYVDTLGQLHQLSRTNNQSNLDDFVIIEDSEGFITIDNKRRKIANTLIPELEKPSTSAQTIQSEPISAPNPIQHMQQDPLVQDNDKSTVNLKRSVKITKEKVQVTASSQPTAGNTSSHPKANKKDASQPNTSNTVNKLSAEVKQMKKPQPILTSSLDTKKAAELLEKTLGHNNFYFRPAAKGDTSIITKNDEDFKATLDLLKSSNIQGHAYTLKSEKRHNIILRNLCPTFNEEDIAQGIQAMNLDVRVANIEKYSTSTSRKNGEDLNLWLIQLEPDSDVRALLAQR